MANRIYRSKTLNGTYQEIGEVTTEGTGSVNDQPEGIYYYKVTAVNEFGESGQSAAIMQTVIADPSTIKYKEAINKIILITPIPDYASAIEIEASSSKDFSEDIKVLTTTTNTEITISDLEGRNYFRYRGIGTNAYSNYSVITKYTQPVLNLIDLTITQLNKKAILYWTYEQTPNKFGEIAEYAFNIYKNNILITQVDSSISEYTFDNIIEDTSFKVEVIVGLHKENTPEIMYSPIFPMPVENLTAETATNTKILVKWEKPISMNPKLYILKYKTDALNSDLGEYKEIHLPNDTFEYIIDAPLGASIYTIALYTMFQDMILEDELATSVSVKHLFSSVLTLKETPIQYRPTSAIINGSTSIRIIGTVTNPTELPLPCLIINHIFKYHSYQQDGVTVFGEVPTIPAKSTVEVDFNAIGSFILPSENANIKEIAEGIVGGYNNLLEGTIQIALNGLNSYIISYDKLATDISTINVNLACVGYGYENTELNYELVSSKKNGVANKADLYVNDILIKEIQTTNDSTLKHKGKLTIQLGDKIVGHGIAGTITGLQTIDNIISTNMWGRVIRNIKVTYPEINVALIEWDEE